MCWSGGSFFTASFRFYTCDPVSFRLSFANPSVLASIHRMRVPSREHGLFEARVSRRRILCPDHFEIRFVVDDYPEAQPGQFLQIRCHHASFSKSIPTDDSHDCRSFSSKETNRVTTRPSILRRPFSIAGLSRTGNRSEIDIIGRVVGTGTSWLNALSPGARVSILGPLGNGFTIPPKHHSALLIAGGVGLPPIRWWGEVLRKRTISCTSIYGVKQRQDLPVTLISEPSATGEYTHCIEEFARHGISSAITTDDGSCGMQGNVADCMLRHITHLNDAGGLCVYACGPQPMLRRVSEVCIDRGIFCELAMERVMACGMGTCQSCVVRLGHERDESGWRYALCCRDGPVFEAQQVVW
ncbi:MAG: dihydroorotate dehydrogenase electron transfer subunit [Phycisphaerae bacterium]